MAEILVTSLVSSSTKLPRIELHVPNGRAQLSPLEAIDLAMNILKCVNGAQADAFIFDWVKKRIPGAGDHEAANLMEDFRHFRDRIDIKERNR